MGDGDKDTRFSPAQLAQMAMGFLLGASGAGVGIALVGKEGFQIYGIALFGICAVVALIFFYAVIGWAKDEQRRRDNLKVLAGLYVSSLKDIGGLLAVRLEGRAKDMEVLLERNNIETMKESVRNLRADVLKILSDDLRGRGKTSNPKAGTELFSHFQDGLNEITEHWQELCVRSVSLAVGPPDEGAKPVG